MSRESKDYREVKDVKETKETPVTSTPPVEKKKVEEKPVDKYDEDLEGYYVISSSIVNIRTVPGGTKKDTVIRVLMNGMKPFCDGHYAVVSGEKWLKLTYDNATGYISERHLMKL